MHIALKKIKFDLERFLPRGSEEQIEEIYNIAKEEYCKMVKEREEKLNKELQKTETESVDNSGEQLKESI